MKKKFIKALSLLILTAGLLFGLTSNNSVKADEPNPDCPNGCVAEYSGCYCYGYYPWFTEAGG